MKKKYGILFMALLLFSGCKSEYETTFTRGNDQSTLIEMDSSSSEEISTDFVCHSSTDPVDFNGVTYTITGEKLYDQPKDVEGFLTDDVWWNMFVEPSVKAASGVNNLEEILSPEGILDENYIFYVQEINVENQMTGVVTEYRDLAPLSQFGFVKRDWILSRNIGDQYVSCVSEKYWPIVWTDSSAGGNHLYHAFCENGKSRVIRVGYILPKDDLEELVGTASVGFLGPEGAWIYLPDFADQEGNGIHAQNTPVLEEAEDSPVVDIDEIIKKMDEPADVGGMIFSIQAVNVYKNLSEAQAGYELLDFTPDKDMRTKLAYEGNMLGDIVHKDGSLEDGYCFITINVKIDNQREEVNELSRKHVSLDSIAFLQKEWIQISVSDKNTAGVWSASEKHWPPIWIYKGEQAGGELLDRQLWLDFGESTEISLGYVVPEHCLENLIGTFTFDGGMLDEHGAFWNVEFSNLKGK